MSIITLGVEDLDRSISFYKDGLGLPLREPRPPSIAFFELRGTWLALYGKDDLAEDAQISEAGSGFPRFTIAHNVGSEAEVDATLEEAQAAGAKIVKQAQKADWGGYSGYFSDPDGFLWEVAWNPHFAIE